MSISWSLVALFVLIVAYACWHIQTKPLTLEDIAIRDDEFLETVSSENSEWMVFSGNRHTYYYLLESVHDSDRDEKSLIDTLVVKKGKKILLQLVVRDQLIEKWAILGKSACSGEKTTREDATLLGKMLLRIQKEAGSHYRYSPHVAMSSRKQPTK